MSQFRVLTERQTGVILDLLAGLMGTEQKPGIQVEIATRWPIETKKLATVFPVVAIARDDLVEASFHQDEIEHITDADLVAISRTMRDQYRTRRILASVRIHHGWPFGRKAATKF